MVCVPAQLVEYSSFLRQLNEKASIIPGCPVQANRDGGNCRAQGVGQEQSCRTLKPMHQRQGLISVHLLAAVLTMA